jgi:hypothetical protein
MSTCTSTTKLRQLTFVGPEPKKYTKADSTAQAKLTTEETLPAGSGSDPGLSQTSQQSHALFLIDAHTNQSKGRSAFFAFDCGGTSGRSSLPLTSVPGRLAIQLTTSHISAGTSTYRWSTDSVANGPTNSVIVQNDNTSTSLDEYPGVALWFQKTGSNQALATGTALRTARTDWGALGGITYNETTRTARISDPGLYCVTLYTDPTNLGNNSHTSAHIRLVNPASTTEVYASVISDSPVAGTQLSATGYIHVGSSAKEIDVIADFVGFSGTSAVGFSILINKIHAI